MKWVTHVALSLLIVKVVEIAFLTNLLDSHLAFTVAILYAILPDLDFLVGLKHRTYTHTLYSALIASYPLIFVDLSLFSVGLISYLAHLLGDMMTHSGVRLLYPNETVYYLTPPSWRLRTGSSAEFFLLGILIFGTVGLGYVGEVTEVDKVFELSTDHNVEISLSYYENGVVYHLDRAKVVWSDGKYQIGFVKDGKLEKVSKFQVLDLEILNVERACRDPTALLVHLKTLKRSAWKHRIVVGYSVNEEYDDFTGTGYDLYTKLKNDYDNVKIKVWFYDAR